MTGTFDPAILRLTDNNGVTMADAIQAYGGNADPKLLCAPRWKPHSPDPGAVSRGAQGPLRSLASHRLPLTTALRR